MAVCNKDCFACPFPDCINDDFDLDDRAESKWIDSLAKERTEPQKRLAAYQRAYYQANKDEIAARQRAYREANKDEIAAYQRAYYQANRERLLARQAAYDRAHKDELADYRRGYYAANKDKANAAAANYRAKPRDMAAAAAVTRYRKEHGLTQAAFGRMVGLSQPSISLLEAGRLTIPSRVLALIGRDAHTDESTQ